MAKEQEKKETQPQPQPPFMYVEGTPLAWHADMQKGHFAPFGDHKKAVTEMKIQLLGWRFFDAMLYTKPSKLEKEFRKLIETGIEEETAKEKVIKNNTKQWVELFFVQDFDIKKTNQPVCSMLLKTYSLQNFTNELKKYLYEVKEDGEQCTPKDIIFELKTTEKKKEDLSFFMVEFKSELAKKEDVAFIETHTQHFNLYDEANLEQCRFNLYTYVPTNKVRGINPPERFWDLFPGLLALKQAEAEPQNTEAEA